MFPETTTTKSIYIWNMLGNFSNALLTVLSMMIITQNLTSCEADIFSIGWAVGQLMATIGTFQVRMYQATDINGKFSFEQYFKFRVICLFLMLSTSFGYVIYLGYDTYKAFIILLLCFFRAVDCFADLYEGWFQQKERLDISGKSLFLRVVIGLLVLVLITIYTKNLTIMCISLVLSYSFCFYFFDVKVYYKFFGNKNKTGLEKNKNWLKRMIRETFPLFINSFLAISIMNSPKISIDMALQNGLLEEGAQTVYAVLFMPASFLTLFYMIFRPLITEMAISWDRKDIYGFSKILKKIILILFVFSLFVLIAAYFLGCPILSIFYGIDLNQQSWSLIILLLGGCLYTFACIIDNALLVMRRHYVLVVGYVLTWIVVNFISDYLVNLYGVRGGALAYMLSMLFFLLSIILLFYNEFRKIKNSIEFTEKRNS